METPEWDIFKRIERLEDKTKSKLTLKDTSILSVLTFEIAFYAMGLHAPEFVRKHKDVLLGKLKTMGFSKEWLGILEEDLLSICDGIEEIVELQAKRKRVQ